MNCYRHFYHFFPSMADQFSSYRDNGCVLFNESGRTFYIQGRCGSRYKLSNQEMRSYRFKDGETWRNDRHTLEGADEVDPRFGSDGWAESTFRTPNLQWDGTHRGYSPYPTRNDSHDGVYHSIHPNTPYGSSAVHLNQSHSVWLNHDNYQNPYAAGYGASTPLKSRYF